MFDVRVGTLLAVDPDNALASMFTTDKYLHRHQKPLGPSESKSTPPSSHKRCRNTSCTTYRFSKVGWGNCFVLLWIVCQIYDMALTKN